MSGVGRGRGAVLPAWMKAKGLDAPAAPGAAPQEAARSTLSEKISSIGSKRTFDSIDTTNASSPATAIPAASVAAPASTSLPPGWHESFDPNYQRTYYYNYSTGERTWTKPASPSTNPSRPTAAAPLKTAPARAQPTGITATASLPASARWEKAIDPVRGKPYYYNHATGESAWSLPEGATLLAEAVAAPAAAAAVQAAAIAANAGAVVAPAAKKQREEEPEEGEVGTVAQSPGELINNDQIRGASVEEKAPSPLPLLRLLPQGWSEAKDPTSGRTYYYNETLNITQWHHPSRNEPDTHQQQQKSDAGNKNNNGDNSTGGGGGGGGDKPMNSGSKNKNQPALDPMDPSSYSDAPRGGWGAGLGKETDM